MAKKQSVGPSLLDFSDVPGFVQEYLAYSRAVRNLSVNTINGYYIDLRTFLRYIQLTKQNIDLATTPFEDIPVRDIVFDDISSVSTSFVYDYLFFLTEQLHNSPKTRARKLSSLKSFFRYLTAKTQRLSTNPVLNIDIPSLKSELPKYLSLEESLELLRSVQTEFPSRDYCILTLFLNCGMRLSELVGINLNDFKDNTIRILGKGNKERLVYLNASCLSALENYLPQRASLDNLKDKDALFVSARRGTRLTPRRVEQIVAQCLAGAGLAGRGYSPHKLRHTAATLMYRFGNVDMLALKEILGHAHVTTTEIYTHIGTEQLENAVSSSPLSKVKTPSAMTKAPGRSKRKPMQNQQDNGAELSFGGKKEDTDADDSTEQPE